MDSERTCWVCFGTDKDTRAEWISPCRCSGSTKWVHHACLRRWLNESQNREAASVCPQCKTPYTVEEPSKELLVVLGDHINKLVNSIAPVACGLLTAASFWAGLSVYGAVTFAHVCGRDGQLILRSASPLRLLLVMPVIPFVLVLVRVRVAVRVRVRVNRAAVAAAAAAQGAGEQQAGPADTPAPAAEDTHGLSFTLRLGRHVDDEEDGEGQHGGAAAAAGERARHRDTAPHHAGTGAGEGFSEEEEGEEGEEEADEGEDEDDSEYDYDGAEDMGEFEDLGAVLAEEREGEEDGRAAAPRRNDQLDLQLPDMRNPVSFSRLVAGGLLLPYIASCVGKLCFRGTDMHPLDRTLLGGVVFLVAKGLAKHYYRMRKESALSKRRILNFAP